MKKLKKTAVTLLTAAVALGGVSAFAANAANTANTGTTTESAVDIVASDGEIVFPIEFDTSTMSTVNGYIATIKYDPADVTPVLSESDILGDECYAVSNIDRGYLVADKTEDGTLVVSWADKEFYSFDEEGNSVMATVTFEVNPDTENETTEISATLSEVARYSDVMATENEYFYSKVYDLTEYTSETTESDDVIIPDDVESGDSIELLE